MLTHQNPPAPPRASPEPAALSVGSPAAHALHELWVGDHSVRLYIEDHSERLATSATIAAHLVRRAGIKVSIRVAHRRDRSPVLDLLADQLPLEVIAAPSVEHVWPDERSWPNDGLPAEATSGVIVAVRDQVITDTHQVCITPASTGAPAVGVTATCVTGRRVELSRPPAGPPERRALFRLGDLPIDIAFAGAPESRC